MVRRWISVMAAVWACAATASADSGARVFSQERPARPDGIVEVLSVAGSVRVSGWDRPTVSIEGALGEGAREVSLTGDEHRTTVEVMLEDGVTQPGPTRLAVRVPAGSRVEVGTVYAGVQVRDVTGVVLLNTVNGHVRVSGQPREVEAKSLKGDIDLAVETSRVKLTSAAGTATLMDVTGEAEVSTISGNVVVEGGRYDRGRFKTVSGDLLFSAGMREGGGFDFQSHSGSITIRVPASTPADFVVSTYEGRIVNDLSRAGREPPPGPGGRPALGGRRGPPPGPDYVRSRPDRTRLSFAIGPGTEGAQDAGPDAPAGRAHVIVSSFSGDVALHRK